MHIEFRLPRGAGGMAAAHYYHKIKKQVEQWAKNNSVTIQTRTSIKAQQPYICISFDLESQYTLFVLSFNPVDIPGWQLVNNQ